MSIRGRRYICDLCGRELSGKTGMFRIEIVNPRENDTDHFDLCGMCYEDVLFWKDKRSTMRREEEED